MSKGSFMKRKRNSNVIDHRIENWIIRESSEPFQEIDESISPIKQYTKQSTCEINEWSIDEVCLFFAKIVGTHCYDPILKDQLIDGAALVLLEEKHLINVFKMPYVTRAKIINEIDVLKRRDNFRV